MARAALEHLGPQKILFLPTGTTRYRSPARADGKHRLAMLELALAGEPRYQIDARELAPGVSGYTVDTLKELRRELGADVTLHLLMGADQYEKFETWHRPDEIRRLAKVGVFVRPGFQVGGAKTKFIPFEPMPVSASDIRARAARGEDLAALVPAPVAAYIAEHRLYA